MAHTESESAQQKPTERDREQGGRDPKAAIKLETRDREPGSRSYKSLGGCQTVSRQWQCEWSQVRRRRSFVKLGPTSFAVRVNRRKLKHE